jgi:hypothetical protein
MIDMMLGGFQPPFAVDTGAPVGDDRRGADVDVGVEAGGRTGRTLVAVGLVLAAFGDSRRLLGIGAREATVRRGGRGAGDRIDLDLFGLPGTGRPVESRRLGPSV